MKKDYYGKEVEFLDFDLDDKLEDTALQKEFKEKINGNIDTPKETKDLDISKTKHVKRKLSLKPLKKELNIESFKPVILSAVFIFFAFVSIQYFLGWDLFQIYVHKVTPEYKKAINTYTLTNDGKNLTFYNDNTFKYVYSSVVITGTYTKTAIAYNLVSDKDVCTLEIKNQVLVTSCPLLLEQNEIDKKQSNSNYQKIFFDKNNESFKTMKTTFLEYVNGLSVSKKWPSLKSSEIISIKNCSTVDALKTLSCEVTYFVEPSDDISKTPWKEDGTIVGNKIKKMKIASFTKGKDSYQFIS